MKEYIKISKKNIIINSLVPITFTLILYFLTRFDIVFIFPLFYLLVSLIYIIPSVLKIILKNDNLEIIKIFKKKFIFKISQINKIEIDLQKLKANVPTIIITYNLSDNSEHKILVKKTFICFLFDWNEILVFSNTLIEKEIQVVLIK